MAPPNPFWVEFPLRVLLVIVSDAEPLLSPRLVIAPPKPFELGAELLLIVVLRTVSVALPAVPSLKMAPPPWVSLDVALFALKTHPFTVRLE